MLSHPGEEDQRVLRVPLSYQTQAGAVLSKPTTSTVGTHDT